MPVAVVGIGRAAGENSEVVGTISFGSLLLRVWIRASLFVYPLAADMVPMVPAIGAPV